ncbi:SNF2 family N-terminal domain-containing protein [Diplogelasinospora grovesii]|uniref:SNF2 family N-terminal domain-containing protein n=1 Tax=Diplogelasinospora grovesii TaxID=303347 RepID=A0AAN6N8Z7_9PEZI|nr:SNF2 family N-terminal domain-containing protein [Diplogelasinospora grovesii]
MAPGSRTNAHGHPNSYPVQVDNMAWNPNALLNPKGSAASSASKTQPMRSASTPVITGNGGLPPQGIVYQFPNPQDDLALNFSEMAYPGQPNGHTHHNPPMMPIFQNGSGFGERIERFKNVQDRIAVPQPKRRKTQAESDPPAADGSIFGGGGGGGVLSEQFREQRETQSTAPSTPTIKPFETVDLTDGDSDSKALDKPKDPVKDEEVCFGMVEGATINCHKVPAPKPGMVSINGSDYWPQVKVVLKRRVDDTTNRILVYDCTRQVFGTVDPKTSACLAPLLDSVLQIRTDCRIPMRRKEPGEKIGQSISRVFKFELMMYGPRKFAPHVGRHLVKSRVNLLSPPRVDAGLQYFNPLAKENRAQPSPRPSGMGDQAPPPQAPAIVRTVEEIRSEVLGVFDSLPKSEDLPEMDPDERIQTSLLTHQRQALYFMTNREVDRVCDVNDAVLTSTWQRRKDQHGADVYYNVVTNQSQRERPPAALGGILADMMGLGKTLSVLSLVATTLDDAVAWSGQMPTQPKAPEKKASQASRHFEIPKPQTVGLTPLRQNGKATLLICPLSTITNWEEQIKQHVKPGTLSYHIYHGPNRIKDVAQLSQFDIVMTTYGSVSSELNSRVKNKKGVYPLEEIGWFRIVLDEAHMIREQNTLAFKSICRLQASRRWAVTGTPVQNRLEDLASLLAFLRLKPFDEKSKFLQYIIQPFKNADPEIVPKLRVLIDTITLRRLKDKIDLPPRKDEIIRLQFTPEEKSIYDWFAKTAQDRVQALTGQGIGQERILGGRTMIHILRSILQLRLICAHGKDLLSDDDLAELQGMTADTPIDIDDSDDEQEKPHSLGEAKAYEMLYLMQEGNSDNCVKCNRKLGSNEVVDLESERQEDILGYMVPCVHVYCPACVGSVAAGTRHHNYDDDSRCDICATAPRSSYVELRRTRADMEHESRTAKSSNKSGGIGKIIADERYSGPHTKTRALIEDLLECKRQTALLPPGSPPFKSVVFSGWTSHLDLIQIALNSVGITYTRLDGKMTRTARNAAMDSFRDDPSVQVILVSIMAGGLGLNLTTANSVYVMEPQFNPAAEAQAIDRVHRLGQTRPVRTVRYIMEDSFEEKMLKLQDKKTKLASLSMDGRDKGQVMDRTEAARQRLMDLRSLFK